MRVFIAVDITPEAKKEIKKLLKVFQKKYWPIKWGELEKVHMTLAFLGSIKEDKLESIKTACKKAVKGIKPFIISFKGLGCFSNWDYPKIIWLGLKGDLKSLANLQKQLKDNLKKAGFKIDSRPFSPHITIGRVKKARVKQRKEIGRQLKKFRILNLKSEVKVDRLVIYKSKCLPSGSIYNKLEEVLFNIS